MTKSSKILPSFLLKKAAIVVLLSASVAASAALGDGGKNQKQKEASVLLPYKAQNFSLRSNYNYRSNNFLSAPEKKHFIMLNPVVTYQKGNAAYILPLRKMPLLGKIRFTSAPRQF